MNEFDILLEHRLRQMLDPVVAHRPPVRRGRLNPFEPILTLPHPEVELVAKAVPVASPAVASAPRFLS